MSLTGCALFQMWESSLFSWMQQVHDGTAAWWDRTHPDFTRCIAKVGLCSDGAHVLTFYLQQLIANAGELF